MAKDPTLYRCEFIMSVRLPNNQQVDKFSVKKFDTDFNLLAEYTVSGNDCTCPAHSAYCRHRAMVKMSKGGWWKEGTFLDYDNNTIIEPPQENEI